MQMQISVLQSQVQQVDELKRQLALEQRAGNDWKEKWNYQVRHLHTGRAAQARGRHGEYRCGSCASTRVSEQILPKAGLNGLGGPPVVPPLITHQSLSSLLSLIRLGCCVWPCPGCLP